jgi:Relaxase/Mobilisation nuclease domain
MIAKVTFGSSGRGLIRYLFGPGQANEHTDQRVIAAGLELGGDALAGGNLSSQQIADIGAGLDAAHEEFGTNPKGGHILHVSLSLPPGDRQLSDDQWAQIAHKAMEALGLEGEGKQPAAWVAIGHGTSANGNQHVHLAASLVRVDGRRVNAWQSRRTLSRLCAEIESTYGLTVIEGREGKGMPGLSRTELERTAREQLAEPPRLTLARMVREASVASRDEAEFVRRLRGSGVLLRPRFETGGKEAVVGYSVAVRTRDGTAPIWFGGGKLAKDLTLPNLRQFWEVSAADRTSAVNEWSAAKALAPGRETIVGIPDDWRRAAGAIERAVEKLKEVPVSDLAAWRGASREAAGLFAAWSRRFERDTPGPMAAAADALARSAQSRPGDPVPKRDAVGSFRGVAAIVAQSQLSNKSPVAWAMLIDQLGRTLRTIGDAHVARGETETARGLVDDLSRELGELRDRFETSSSQELVPGERVTDERNPPSGHEIAKTHVARHRGRGPSRGRGFGR